MTSKPKIALYWCASCGGCEESVIDLAEDLVGLSAAAHIVFWPIALDWKYEDLASLRDGEITATLINGAIRMEEQERLAKLLRRKSKFLIAHGTCACFGGVYALANLYSRQEILDASYRRALTVKNPEGVLPGDRSAEAGGSEGLSRFQDRVRATDQVVEVDYYLPGCPPTPEQIGQIFSLVVEDKLPPKGTVMAETTALCETCPRKETLPTTRVGRGFKRLYEIALDPDRCFLDQGIICLGPATRGGCGARCMAGNMPCRGCFGPAGTVRDQGAKALSFLASLVAPKGEGEIERIGDFFPDIAGLFYRYTLASSILKGKWGDDTR